MEAYLLPAREAEAEFVEKKSRFIGHIWQVETEQQARACIDATRKRYHDARHNCWCYRLTDGTVRYSDDGEPQGTAGQPMLNVFERENVQNVVCVVTRYFGGILLGTGGLTRAYTKGAKDALDAAGIAQNCVWDLWDIPCSYSLFERVKLELAAAEGTIEDTQYTDGILLKAAVPENASEPLLARLRELSAGTVKPTTAGKIYRAKIIK